MKHYLRLLLITVFGISYTFTAIAQSKIKTFQFKKGEVLDLLLVSTKPDSKAAYQRYKDTAFPIAIENGYSFLPGYTIKKYTQGNIQPTSFIFGKWETLQNRETFTNTIEKRLPDFHIQRRTLFSMFNLVYYEMSKDLTFTINAEKFNVVTAYWKKSDNAFRNFKKEWLATAEGNGGTTILALTEGISPLGYYYKPDFLTITEWKNQEAFEAFYKKNMAMDHKAILHMNQFIIN